MKRGLKIALFTLSGIGLLFIVLVVVVLYEISRPEPQHHVSQEAQLSNGGILRVHGVEYHGPHGVPFFWDASYQTARGAVKEAAGIWGGGADEGDVVGCPVGNLVVVNPLLSYSIFVRTAAGHWKSIYLEIYGKTPPAFGIQRVMAQTSLSAEDLEKLHSFFSGLVPYLDDFRPSRMQFVDGSRELWADFYTPIGRTLENEGHRVRFKLTADGEHFQLLDIQKIPSAKGFIRPDRDPDPICTRVSPLGPTN
jgi:hypothetical protein